MVPTAVEIAITATAALLMPHVTSADAITAEHGTSITGSRKSSIYSDNGAEAGCTAKVCLKKNAPGQSIRAQ